MFGGMKIANVFGVMSILSLSGVFCEEAAKPAEPKFSATISLTNEKESDDNIAKNLRALKFEYSGEEDLKGKLMLSHKNALTDAEWTNELIQDELDISSTVAEITKDMKLEENKFYCVSFETEKAKIHAAQMYKYAESKLTVLSQADIDAGSKQAWYYEYKMTIGIIAFVAIALVAVGAFVIFK
ncbi:hypothetical protein PAPHI01_0830 [Pancytospora philotis]|nr:hypothetical protein PAPHI01_0830 [Pancytospora philotis]